MAAVAPTGVDRSSRVGSSPCAVAGLRSVRPRVADTVTAGMGRGTTGPLPRSVALSDPKECRAHMALGGTGVSYQLGR